MENKKLLKFIIKDLSELEELVAEKGNNTFDDLEVEFLHTRLQGAKKLVQLLYERENSEQKEEIQPESLIKEKELETVEIQQEITKETQLPEIIEEKVESISEEEIIHVEEKKKTEKKQCLGDSFSKEKSVNELMATDNQNLGHKLSNRSVNSIQLAIGINDRFQFIRELFEGNPDNFVRAITELDAMKNIEEAVGYLKQNFEWQENEISLKFVNLVKRRFPNE